MKLTFPLLAAAMLGACTAPGGPMAETPATPLCEFTITDQSAWKDMMPGPDGPSGQVVVMLEVKADGLSRRFESQGVSENGTLMLDVVEWGPDAGLNKIVYRSKGIDPARVEIRCGGDALTTIDEIMKVY
ncbi:hypothetical protein [Henriciella aquimarina]|uniref:hypothetical protein n=1 Tax=Henriciella aquimarina TaxID=545261 RepID=UPI0009FE6B7F|nr:hypothetical protein [Henriciella aquimarina]